MTLDARTAIFPARATGLRKAIPGYYQQAIARNRAGNPNQIRLVNEARRRGGGVQAKYGPSGMLKDEIAGGAHAEVFASANMEHPQALVRAVPSCFSCATGCAPWCGLDLSSSRQQFSTACSTQA